MADTMARTTVNLDFVLDGIVQRHSGSDAPALRDRLHQTLGINASVDVVRERLDKIASYRAQLQALRALPVIEQRTPAWYAMRESLMTASDLAQALDCAKFGSQKDFIVKKCGYDVAPFDHTCPPLKWGTMFEPLANEFYQALTGTRVHEFGLLRHETVDWFGCSPDGVSDLGIMLEIKCPFRRRITGDIIPQYYHQMQGQLEVARLRECDFLECGFKECADEQEWLGVGRDAALAKGIILERDLGNRYDYLYSPWGATDADATGWRDQQQDGAWRVRYYCLDHYHLTRVYHDPAFVRDKLAEAKKVWGKVLMYRDSRELYDLFVGGSREAKAARKAGSQPVIARRSDWRPSSQQFTDYAFIE
jgi:putative phage-type endonuclease